MTGLMAISMLVLSAQAAALPVEAPAVATRDVAYDDLANGRANEAAAALEALREAAPEDPATLINLGSAYARLGHRARAAEAFHAALDSPVRYRLELADGNWVDSRQAARLALDALARSYPLAALDD